MEMPLERALEFIAMTRDSRIDRENRVPGYDPSRAGISWTRQMAEIKSRTEN